MKKISIIAFLSATIFLGACSQNNTSNNTNNMAKQNTQQITITGNQTNKKNKSNIDPKTEKEIENIINEVLK